ncbi:TPA: 3-phosphoshikimate 1-carboxyvinyltransferase [bacterium]|nr:3-phosphoshikimate 1-carboxyvinyltransferase [bacterium]
MEALRVKQATSLQGSLTPPPDKSISHRALILSALAQGEMRAKNLLWGEDCLRTLRAFQALGIRIEGVGARETTVFGRGGKGFKEPADVIDLGNSGTSMRLLLGVLCGQDFYTVVTGDNSLRSRPMRRVVQPLIQMGAKIFGRDGGNYAPLSIVGSSYLEAIQYQLPIASAQVKSALLLAGLLAEGETEIEEPIASRDHTERILTYLGVEIKKEGLKVSLCGPLEIEGEKEIVVPGDISSAAFFIVAASLLPESLLVVERVGTNPTRCGAITALKEMGAEIEITNEEEICGEPVAQIKVKGGPLKGVEIDPKSIPAMIDEIPILAVAATMACGRTHIWGARELRVKETDRLKALTTELSKMGAKIEELPDGLIIEGPSLLVGSEVNSYGDHRIAMALTIAGLLAKGETIIQDTECIKTSFPDFEETLKRLTVGS